MSSEDYGSDGASSDPEEAPSVEEPEEVELDEEGNPINPVDPSKKDLRDPKVAAEEARLKAIDAGEVPPEVEEAPARGKRAGPKKAVVTDDDIERYVALKLAKSPGAEVRITKADLAAILKYKKEHDELPLPAVMGASIPTSRNPRKLSSIVADAKEFATLEAELMAEGKLITIDEEVDDEQMVWAMKNENLQLVQEAQTLEKKFRKRRRYDGSMFQTELVPGCKITVSVWVTKEVPDKHSSVIERVSKAAGIKLTREETKISGVEYNLHNIDVLSEQEMWERYGEFYGARRRRLDELAALLEVLSAALEVKATYQGRILERVAELEAIIQAPEEEGGPGRGQREEARKALAKINRIRDNNLLDADAEALMLQIDAVKAERVEIGIREKRLVPSAAPVRLTSKNRNLLLRRDRIEELDEQLRELETNLERTIVYPNDDDVAILEGIEGPEAATSIREHFDNETKAIHEEIAKIRGEIDRLSVDVSERQIKSVQIFEGEDAQDNSDEITSSVVLATHIKTKPWVLSSKRTGVVFADGFEVKGNKSIVSVGKTKTVLPTQDVKIIVDPSGVPQEANPYRPDFPRGRPVTVYASFGGSRFPVVGIIEETLKDGTVVTTSRSETLRVIARQRKLFEAMDVNYPETQKVILKVLDDRKALVLGKKFPSRIASSYEACLSLIYETFSWKVPRKEALTTDGLRSTVKKLYFETLRPIIASPSGTEAATGVMKVSLEQYIRARAWKEASISPSRSSGKKLSEAVITRAAEKLKAQEKDAQGLLQSILNDFGGSLQTFGGQYPSRTAFDQAFSRDVVYKLAAQVMVKPGIAAVTQRFIAALASAPSGVGAAGIMAAAINAHLDVVSTTPDEEYRQRIVKANEEATRSTRIAKEAEKLTETSVKKYTADYRRLYDAEGNPKLGLGVTPTKVIGATPYTLSDEELILKINSFVDSYGSLVWAKEFLTSGVLFPMLLLRGPLSEHLAYARTKIAAGDYPVEKLARANIHNFIPEAVTHERFNLAEVKKILLGIEDYFVRVITALASGLPSDYDFFAAGAPVPTSGRNIKKFKPINYPDFRSLVEVLRNPVEACRSSTHTGLTFDVGPKPTDGVTSDLIICYNRGRFICEDKRELAVRIHAGELDDIDERTQQVVLAAYPTLESVPARFQPIHVEEDSEDITFGEAFFARYEAEAKARAEAKAAAEAPPPRLYENVTHVWLEGIKGDAEGDLVVSVGDDGRQLVILRETPDKQPVLLITLPGSQATSPMVARKVTVAPTPEAESEGSKTLKGKTYIEIPEDYGIADVIAYVFQESVSAPVALRGWVEANVESVVALMVDVTVSNPVITWSHYSSVANVLMGWTPGREDLATDEELEVALMSGRGQEWLTDVLTETLRGHAPKELTRTQLIDICNNAKLKVHDEKRLTDLVVVKNIPKYAYRVIAAYGKIKPAERAKWYAMLEAASGIRVLEMCDDVLGPEGVSTPTSYPQPKVATVFSVRELFGKVYSAQTPATQSSAAIALGVIPSGPATKAIVLERLTQTLNLKPEIISEVLASLQVNFMHSLRLLRG